MKGGQRQGSGRKPGSPNKEKKVGSTLIKQIRWHPEDWQQVEAKARAAKQTPSEYIRKAALDANQTITTESRAA